MCPMGIFLALVMVLLNPITALAQSGSSADFGNTSLYSFQELSGTSQKFGNAEFYHFNNGQSATRQHFASPGFCFSPSSGLSGTTLPHPITVALFTDVDRDAINHLREFTLATSEETVLGGKAAMLMGLVETSRSVPTKQISVALTDEVRFFTVSIVPDTDDIILTVKRDAAVRKMYLTNSKFFLRAAVVHENGTPRVISNDQAVAGFEALLAFWIEKAKNLQAGHHVH